VKIPLGRLWRAGPEQKIVGTVVYGPVTMVSGVRGDARIEHGRRPLYRVEPGALPLRTITTSEARQQPSLLLNAQYEQVEFRGRSRVLDEMRNWLVSPARPASVLLLHGPGGQGKSRLGAHFVRLSQREGWAVAQVHHGEDPALSRVPLGAATGRPATGAHRGLLLVVDYAERWPGPDLITFLRDCTEQGTVRVLLIARPAGKWWFNLAQRLRRLGLSAERISLAPLTDEVGSHELYSEASAYFARALDVRDRRAGPDLTGPEPGRP